MKIRPHHLLCMGNYIGRGYDAAFSENMTRVIASLRAGEKFDIVDGADDICSSCPHFHNGICDTDEKVNRYDAAVKKILGLSETTGYVYHDIEITAEKQIYGKDLFDTVCGDCEWHALCLSIKNNNYKNREKF